MKELLNSIVVLVMGLVVTSLMWTIGALYSFGYSIWLSITLKKWNAFFIFWWRLLDGFSASIAHILYETAIGLDMSWNVNGEILEDIVTAKQDTTFMEKNITVSASIGKLEIDGDLNKTGKKFSRFLSKVFNQKQHAIDSWNFYVDKCKLNKEYFN